MGRWLRAIDAQPTPADPPPDASSPAPAPAADPKQQELHIDLHGDLAPASGPDWDAAADVVLAALYVRVSAAFDVRPWPIPGRGDDHHQTAIEAACLARDLHALVRCADAYVLTAEKFAACFAQAIPPDSER